MCSCMWTRLKVHQVYVVPQTSTWPAWCSPDPNERYPIQLKCTPPGLNNFHLIPTRLTLDPNKVYIWFRMKCTLLKWKAFGVNKAKLRAFDLNEVGLMRIKCICPRWSTSYPVKLYQLQVSSIQKLCIWSRWKLYIIWKIREYFSKTCFGKTYAIISLQSDVCKALNRNYSMNKLTNYNDDMLDD